MKTKKIIIFILSFLIFVWLVFYINNFNGLIVNNRDSKQLEVIGRTPSPEERSIQIIDTSSWLPAQIHLDLQILLPPTWHVTSDGIYNYDQTKVTGIRDPNFPNNSFKCVFLDAKGQDRYYEIINEEKISDDPQINLLKIKWNDNQEPTPARTPGEETQIYLVDPTTRSEIQIECVIFKGEMTLSDRDILENVLFKLK